MKYEDRLNCGRLEAQRKALYLRYGDEEPPLANPPPPLLTHKRVAELMRVRTCFVQRLLYTYFHPEAAAAKRLSLQPPKLNSRPSKGAKVTLKTITAEEVQFLTDPTNLRAWASYSLSGRCVLFHRRFPDRWLDRLTLGRLLR